jgi:hypothetical protein
MRVKEKKTMHYFLFALCLTFASPVMAQDAPEAPSTEEAAPEVTDAAEATEKATETTEATEKVAETPTPEDIDAAVDDASMLIDAVQNKNWALVFGLLLALMVSVANKFGLKAKVGSKALPWVTSGLAVAGAVGAALLAGIPVMEALPQGLLAGVAAIGGWEMILKHFLAAKKVEADPEPKTA